MDTWRDTENGQSIVPGTCRYGGVLRSAGRLEGSAFAVHRAPGPTPSKLCQTPQVTDHARLIGTLPFARSRDRGPGAAKTCTSRRQPTGLAIECGGLSRGLASAAAGRRHRAVSTPHRTCASAPGQSPWCRQDSAQDVAFVVTHSWTRGYEPDRHPADKSRQVQNFLSPSNCRRSITVASS